MIDAIKSFIDFMPGISGYVIPAVLLMSLIAFIAYGADKKKAKGKKWRISEACLVGLAAFGGAFGALLGMCLFRHKTKHLKFIILVPLLAVVWVILIVKSILM